jgi:hypothetical protein
VTDIQLGLQDPGDPPGLLEAIAEACDGATRGGVIFAWATVGGVNTLFEDPAFEQFLSGAGSFEVIVGVDSITDVPALDALVAGADRFAGLGVRAFYHDRPGILFHPKLSWFASPEGALTLITGSGNFTLGGLRRHWEAFTVIRVGPDRGDELEQQLGAWITRWSACLRELQDADVRARAASNAGREISLKRPARPEDELPEEETEPVDTTEVLVTLLPRNPDRPRQANFKLVDYKGFFGLEVGTKRRVLLQRVDADGTVHDPKVRESVENKRSKNYRLELDGLDYSKRGYAVGVFVRMDGVFLYRVLMPDDPSHDTLSSFIEEQYTGPAHHLGRVRTTVAVLRAAWPESSLWEATSETS